MGQFTIDIETFGAITDRDEQINNQSNAIIKSFKEGNLTVREMVMQCTDLCETKEELFLISQAVNAGIKDFEQALILNKLKQSLKKS